MGHKTFTPFDLIFSDVWGPAHIVSSDAFCYFVIYIDAHTKYIWYYPLVAKSNIFSIFHRFQVFCLSVNFYEKLNLFKLIGVVNNTS
jgi:hypothetical protein